MRVFVLMRGEKMKSERATDKRGSADQAAAFEQTLRRLLNTPPDHKTAKKPEKKKPAK